MRCVLRPSQGRWSRFEEELDKQAGAQVLSMEQGKASKRQIFNRCGSDTDSGYAILSLKLDHALANACLHYLLVLWCSASAQHTCSMVLQLLR